MKTFLFLFLTLITSFESISQEKCEVGILGFDYIAPRRCYYFRCDQLCNGPDWSGREQFPLDLGLASRSAIVSLNKQYTNNSPLTLQYVILRRLDPTFARSKIENAAVCSNKWIVAFVFLTKNNKNLSAVVLLDGIEAEERSAPPGTPVGNSEIWKNHYMQLLHSEIWLPEVLNRLHSPDLQVSSVRWDPSTESNPIDIPKQASAVAIQIQKEKSLGMAELRLERVDFGRFMPSESAADRFHHWVCVMTFKCVKSGHEYFTYSLLDGQVVKIFDTTEMLTPKPQKK